MVTEENKETKPSLKEKQDAHQLVGQAKRRTTKIRHKAVGGSIFGQFSNFDKFRSEVACDSYPVWV